MEVTKRARLHEKGIGGMSLSHEGPFADGQEGETKYRYLYNSFSCINYLQTIRLLTGTWVTLMLFMVEQVGPKWCCGQFLAPSFLKFSNPRTSNLVLPSPLPSWSPGNDDVELTKSDDDTNDDAGIKLRKQLGIPEADPDALPSASLNKYLKLDIKLPRLKELIWISMTWG